jgi:hypothetical protein
LGGSGLELGIMTLLESPTFGLPEEFYDFIIFFLLPKKCVFKIFCNVLALFWGLVLLNFSLAVMKE